MNTNTITESIIGSAIAVHRALGPGLLESAYEHCMVIEMAARGLRFERQKLIPLVFRGVAIESGYRIDLLVEHEVVVELKSVAQLEEIHTAQILTYLKLADCRLGLLINFNVPLLKDGIRRVILSRSRPSASSAALR